MSYVRNHINHSKLEFASGAGTASVSVCTGRLLLERPDISVGGGNFAIGVSHVYNSRFYNPSGIPTYAGTNWKLNIQEYICQKNEAYIYSAGGGYTHIFELYDSGNEKKYFDKTGSGLTLVVPNSGNRYIEDPQGGKLYFDGEGRLIRTESAVNKEIVKIIQYTDDKITAVYDTRNDSRRIEFLYNGDLLSEMGCVEGNVRHRLQYSYDESGNLLCVKEYANGRARQTVTFAYKDQLLRYALRNIDNSTLRFTYDGEKRVQNVSSGLAKTVIYYSEARDALFASSSTFCGRHPCGLKERELLGYRISEDEADYQQGDTDSASSYHQAYTTVENENGIKMDYFFNQKGFTTAILEKAPGGYRTPFKQTGIRLSDSGSGTAINGNGAVSCSGSYTVSADKLQELANYLNKNINKDNENYLVSFWFKRKSDGANALNAVMEIHYEWRAGFFEGHGAGERSETFRVRMDHSANNAWQYVTLPIHLDTYDGFFKGKQASTGITLTVPNETFEIADMRVSAGLAPRFCLTESAANSPATPSVALNDIVHITYQGSGFSGGGDIGADFFMTESDIVQTYFSRKGGTSFTLTCNGGTKRVANVHSVVFKNAGNKGYAFGIDDNYPRYRYESLPSSGDGRSYTYTQYVTAQFDGVHKPCVRQETKVYQHPDGAKNQVVSSEIFWTDYFGKQLRKQDAYGVCTDWIYDSFGNLSRTRTWGEKTNESIVNTYTYQSASDKEKEHLTATTDGAGGGAGTASFAYHPLFGTLASSTQPAASGLSANTASFTYDSFHEKLITAQLQSGNTVYGQNTVILNGEGRIGSISPSDQYRYQIEYDDFGKPTAFKQDGVTMLSRKYAPDSRYVTTTYHRSADTKDEIRMQYNEYGQLTSTGSGGAAMQIVYQKKIPESLSVANIEKITDGFDGKYYHYNYDDDTGKLISYTVKKDPNDQDKDSLLWVQQTGENKTKYELGHSHLNHEREIKYDEKCMIAPRVHSDESWEYTYDPLGRCTGKTTAQTYTVTKAVTYKPNTLLKENIQYKNLRSNSTEIQHTYDLRGNMLSVLEKFDYGHDKKTEFKNSYVYNAANQLQQEKNDALGFTRDYTYTPEGNIQSVTENGVTTVRSYSLGRLTSITHDGAVIESYTYDNCGNPTQFKSNIAMSWSRGNLLSQYRLPLTPDTSFTVNYTYNAQGLLSQKTAGDVTRKYFYDGEKLLGEEITKGKDVKRIRYLYDLDGLCGFQWNQSEYFYLKDATGNVVGLTDHDGDICARYAYDSLGTCYIQIDQALTGTQEAILNNPIRWKGQYYDTDTKLYFIGCRWYDPARGRYISSASPEILLQNVGTVFGLNLYALTTGAPTNLVFDGFNCFPFYDFYYNGEYQSWWGKNGWWVMLIVGAVAAAVSMGAAGWCGGAVAAFAALGKIALGTAIATASMLAIGGAIAGLQSFLTGHGFWQGFSRSVQDNFLDALVMSFAIAAVAVAIESVAGAIQGNVCFIAGTLVLCKGEDGEETHKKIEDIEEGDKVWAYNEETGQSDWKEVVRLFRNTTMEWCDVRICTQDASGKKVFDTITSTPGHKYFVPENIYNRDLQEPYEHASYAYLSDRWVSAKDLKKGDKVLLSDGRYGIVKKVKVRKLKVAETTYNFEVKDFHTYYVGKNGVCVHNSACHLDPSDIRYTQNNGDNVFSRNNPLDLHSGESVDDLITALKNGTVTPDDIPPLEVFKARGKVWSINNRRLYAYKMSGVESVPVKWVERSAMKHLWTGDGINFYLRR